MFDAEQFLDVALGEFKEQAIRVVAQNKEDGTGSLETDARISTIEGFLQGPAVQGFKERLRHQFQELDRQNQSRKLGDGRGHNKRKETERYEDEAMGVQQGGEWVPEGTHAEFVSEQGSEHHCYVPDAGNEPVLDTNLPEAYGPARNRVQRKTDPDSDCRDHL